MASRVVERERRPALGGLAAAFLVSLALHGAGLLGLAAWRSADPPKPPGQQAITIDLAPVMQDAQTVAPAEVAQPEQAVETATLAVPDATATEPTPETVAAAEPDQAWEELVEEQAVVALPPPAEGGRPPDEAAAEPAPQEASTTALSPEAIATDAPPVEALPAGIEGAEALPPEPSVEALPHGAADLIAPPPAPLAENTPETRAVEPSQVVTATGRPRPRPHPARQPTRDAKPGRQPEQKPVRPRRQMAERPTRPPRQVAARPAASAPSSPRRGRLSASRESNAASAASADPTARNRYAALISAAVRRRLRYPDNARSRGSGGTATVRFTVHRSGRVMSASLVRSAGDGTLDGAALATVSPGTALPPAPAGVPQRQITFIVPLRFNLR
jgi:protein TonB